MRIYEGVNTSTGLTTGFIVFATDAGVIESQEPKASLSVLVPGNNKIIINSRIRGQNITPPIDFSTIKDSAGVAWGASLDATVKALCNFMGATSTNVVTGGGGTPIVGFATEARQILEFTVLQNILAKVDNTSINSNPALAALVSSPALATALNNGSLNLVVADNTLLRKAVLIENDTNRTVFIKFGTGAASSTAYSLQLKAGAIYEVPERYRCTEINISIAQATATGLLQLTVFS